MIEWSKCPRMEFGGHWAQEKSGAWRGTSGNSLIAVKETRGNHTGHKGTHLITGEVSSRKRLRTGTPKER